jgi:CheY-like chemotaxis protein
LDWHQLYQPLAKDKGIAFDFVFTNSEPLLVHMDTHRFRQIMNNLWSNALKFTRQGQVSTLCQFEPLEDDQFFLRLEVRDTGIGMSPEHLARLFQAFTQADSSTTRDFGGTGLGLSITKQLVECMGGTIEVTSQVGIGTSFIVKLQIAKAREEGADSPKSEFKIKELKSLKVLLAEDNPVNQKLGIRMLEQLEIRGTIAANGMQAVMAVQSESPDVVLMDMQMPVMDGLDATREIRNLALEKQPYIIGLTANAFGEDRIKCLEAGMNDFLAKPYRLEQLQDVLSKVLNPSDEATPRE